MHQQRNHQQQQQQQQQMNTSTASTSSSSSSNSKRHPSQQQIAPPPQPSSSSSSLQNNAQQQQQSSTAAPPQQQQQQQQSKKQRKIIVAGSRAVGKSAITIQFAEERFVENYNPTIENTFQKTIVYNNIKYVTDIVDTAGQDEFSIFQQQYALGVDGYVLVYSIASRQSFEIVKVVNDKILNSTGNEHIPRILVGNKSDLAASQRKVSLEEGERLARELGIPFVECSAKINEHIGAIFKKLIVLIEGGDINSESPKKEKSSGGCLIN